MRTAWSCRHLYPYTHHRHRFRQYRAMYTPDTDGKHVRLPPWFLRALTPPGATRLRLYLERQAGPYARLEWMTFGDAAAILRDAARPPVIELDPQEWQVEVLHQLKRLVE